MKKGTRKFLFGIISLLALLAVAFYFYTADYYRADETALNVYTTQAAGIQTQGGYTVFTPPEGAAGTAGLIFYPGGKVDERAYAPLLSALAQNGVTCVLVKMPFHLAVLDINAANGAAALAPGVKSWYIGGHSLGGAMASSYAAKHASALRGVVLLGAYPTAQSGLPLLTLVGSNDGVINREKLAAVPDVITIEGGNHAQFGNYGPQQGDGTATITAESQQSETVAQILQFIANVG